MAYKVELSPKSLQRLERAKTCIKDDSDNYHVFVDLEEYSKVGWDARVTNQRSETLFTLREKYQGICGDTYGELLGNYKG